MSICSKCRQFIRVTDAFEGHETATRHAECPEVVSTPMPDNKPKIDTELFELCKEVYERTGWIDVEQYFEYFPVSDEVRIKKTAVGNPVDTTMLPEYVTPLYTSDYLLGKLPKLIENHDNGGSYYFELGTGSEPWEACYGNGFDQYKHTVGADTPLKSLLKLTLALAEAGELPTNDKGGE